MTVARCASLHWDTTVTQSGTLPTDTAVRLSVWKFHTVRLYPRTRQSHLRPVYPCTWHLYASALTTTLVALSRVYEGVRVNFAQPYCNTEKLHSMTSSTSYQAYLLPAPIYRFLCRFCSILAFPFGNYCANFTFSLLPSFSVYNTDTGRTKDVKQYWPKVRVP